MDAAIATRVVALSASRGLANVAVVIVIATGLANGWLLLRDTGLDATSLYQELLLAKISIVGLMIVLAMSSCLPS